MSHDSMGSIREALGLGSEVELVEVATVTLPSIPVQFGLVAQNWVQEIQKVWQGAEFHDVSVPGAPESLAFCRSTRLRVLYISGQVVATPVAISGEPLPKLVQWREENGEQVVAWEVRGLIVLDYPEGTLVLYCSASDFVVYRLPAEPAHKVFPSLHARLSAPAPQLPTIPIPELDAHFMQHPAAPWLSELVTQQIQSADPLTRLAAVGLLARLWTPVGSEAKKAMVASLLQGKRSPAQEYLNHYTAGFTPEVLAWVERQAVQDADTLHDALESVSNDLLELEEPTERQEHADYLRERRDDLESVLEVLEAVQAGANLRLALDSLDRTALEKRMLLDDAGSEPSRRLTNVAWVQPEAWWSVLPDD